MKKTLLFLGSICICTISIFFYGSVFFENPHANSMGLPIPITVLTDDEKWYADNTVNISSLLLKTQTALTGPTLNKLSLEKSRLQLERATVALYQKHLDTIAISLYQNNNQVKYREAFEKYGEQENKADVTPAYAVQFKKKILSAPISPKNQDFQAYAYILGRMNDSPRSNSGGLDKNTLDLMKLAEKWTLKQANILLNNTELVQVFENLGYLPWRAFDLVNMRRTITSEWLSSETKYTRAYLTAQMLFGRNTLGNKINLKTAFQHEKQIAGLSCEANSTTYFYNYYAGAQGKEKIAEKEVFTWFPLDERAPEYVKTRTGYLRKWGDPDKVFVGKVNGQQSISMERLTGYGIHAKWVLPVLKEKLDPLGFTPDLQSFNEMNIVLSLSKNNPVLFWYVLSEDPKKWFSRIDWTTWDGENKTGYIGQHTGIIVGVELTKNGALSKVGYYEGLSKEITWEDWETLKSKAKYFDAIIIAKSNPK